MKTIEDIKLLNKQAGQYFFSENTMRFFNSKIESPLIYNRFFITSERREKNLPKMFTVREALPNGHILSFSEFLAFSSKEKAMKFLDAHIKTLIEQENQ